MTIAMAAMATALVSCSDDDDDDDSTTDNTTDNTPDVTAITADFNTSAHALGESVSYPGGRDGCSSCHCKSGFAELISSGSYSTSASDDPQPIDCNSCHKDDGSYDLVTTAAVELQVSGETIDLGESSNICASCHQAKATSPMITDPNASGTFIAAYDTLSSTHWSPHHGTQASVLTANDGLEISGSVSYSGTTVHKSAGCNTCHKAASETSGVGGHTFNVADESGTMNEAACSSCHSSDIDASTLMTEVEGLLSSLESKMASAGVTTDGHIDIENYDLTVKQAAAYWNYILITDDGSKGVHNPSYTKALLQNSIEVFN